MSALSSGEMDRFARFVGFATQHIGNNENAIVVHGDRRVDHDVATRGALSVAFAVREHLAYLATHGYATSTIHTRGYYLHALVRFLAELEVTNVADVTLSHLDSYQRHLFRHKKLNGQPLSFRTQAQRLIPVKALFAWLARQGVLSVNPALSLELPKTEHRLPEAVLGVDEVECILAAPDTTSALGIRDRAILEVFYSCAIRRSELIGLRVADIDHARGTLFVHQGKGSRDRFVPIGVRARQWVSRYLNEVRPSLATKSRATMFLTAAGTPLAPDVLSRLVSAYVRAGAPNKKGSCHLFRHSTATLMLDAGADVRHVAEMLGHQKLETTMGYTRVSMGKLQEVHARTHPAERSRGTHCESDS